VKEEIAASEDLAYVSRKMMEKLWHLGNYGPATMDYEGLNHPLKKHHHTATPKRARPIKCSTTFRTKWAILKAIRIASTPKTIMRTGVMWLLMSI